MRTVRSGISRGTETLVFRGGVPPAERTRMRAPFQEGDFPGPVKYGYLNVGAVEEGPPELRGRTVFCLYPHQTAYVVPAGAVSVVPEGDPNRTRRAGGHRRDGRQRAVGRRPARRRPGRGRRRRDGRLLRRTAAAAVSRRCGSPSWTSIPSRADIAAALGVDFALPEEADGGCDLVVHTSATSAGLQRSLDLLAPEGTVIDLSWYGDTEVRLSLGGAFHAGRLGIRSSQVGTLSPARAARRTTADRLALALELLRDPAFDALLTGRVALRRAARRDGPAGRGSLPALCHTITYGEG